MLIIILLFIYSTIPTLHTYPTGNDAVDAGEVVQHSGQFFMAETRLGLCADKRINSWELGMKKRVPIPRFFSSCGSRMLLILHSTKYTP